MMNNNRGRLPFTVRRNFMKTVSTHVFLYFNCRDKKNKLNTYKKISNKNKGKICIQKPLNPLKPKTIV